MEKIGNYSKSSLKNGGVIVGGHRIKYVSDDKSFVILLTREGDYVGLYITFEKDGAYVDEEKMSGYGVDKKFSNLESAKRYFHVEDGEVASGVETPDPESEYKKMLRLFKELKHKHPDAVLLFRIGDFYETCHEDAETCAKVLGITLTYRGDVKLTMFPYHALDVYLPKLVRSGYRCAICNEIDYDREKLRIEQQKAKDVKMEQPDAIVHELKMEGSVSSQNEMRKVVTECCNINGISVDRVAVWQHNGNGDFGLAVAFNGKQPTAVVNWERQRRVNGVAEYWFVGSNNEKYSELRKRI